jgi:hypothetical protein
MVPSGLVLLIYAPLAAATSDASQMAPEQLKNQPRIVVSKGTLDNSIDRDSTTLQNTP